MVERSADRERGTTKGFRRACRALRGLAHDSRTTSCATTRAEARTARVASARRRVAGGYYDCPDVRRRLVEAMLRTMGVKG